MKRARLSLVVMLVAIVWTVSGAMAQGCSSVPNPSFTIAQASGPGAAFSGVWEGVWTIQTGMRRNTTPVDYCNRIHISVTGPTGADVMFCLGSQPAARIAAGCTKYSAKIEGNQLTFTSRANINYTFTQAGGSLTGQYTSPVRANEQYTTTFHKL